MNNKYKESTLVLLRHAERPPMPPDSFGNDLSITPEGELASYNYGKEIGSHLHAVHSSPVKRCMETASAIIKGSERNISIIPDSMLGDPGPFICDATIAGENWEQYGPLGVCERLFFSNKPMKGFFPPEIGVTNLLKRMIAHLPPRGAITLFVTHDIIIATLAVRLFGLREDLDLWPEYFEGITICGCGSNSHNIEFKGFNRLI